MEVTVADAATETALAAPADVRRESDFARHVALTVVDVQFQRFTLIAFDQGE